LGREGQSIATKMIHALVKNKTSDFTKFKIQSLLNENLNHIFSQIDEILIRELRNN